MIFPFLLVTMITIPCIVSSNLPFGLRTAADIEEGILNIGLDLRHLLRRSVLWVWSAEGNT